MELLLTYLNNEFIKYEIKSNFYGADILEIDLNGNYLNIIIEDDYYKIDAEVLFLDEVIEIIEKEF